MKKISTGLLLLVFVFSVHALENEQSYGQWTSGVILGDDGIPVYRAINSKPHYGYIAFALDITSNCKKIHPSLLVELRDGADSSGSLNTGTFQARVDTRNIINGSWSSTANQMGDKIVFVNLMATQERKLIHDIKSGKTLRIKISFNTPTGTPIFEKFSLSGSAYAINRATLLCEQSQSNLMWNSNSQKNQNTHRRISDADYF